MVEPAPSIKEDEYNETWFHFAEALLGVCVYLGDIVVGSEIDDVIQPVLDRHKFFAELTAEPR